MATCSCGRTFKNLQALRAHKKACSAHRQAPSAAPSAGAIGRAADRGLGRGTGASPTVIPAAPARPPLDADRARTLAPAVQRPEREWELARQRAAQEAEERRRREQAEQERQRHRRELIQRAKAISGLAWRLKWGFTLTPEVQARVMREIEHELAALPVDELPWSEVQTIAEGAWGRVCVPAEAEQREARRRADEAAEQQRNAREAAAQNAREQQEQTLVKWRREPDEARQQAARKHQLVALGETYAREALAELDDPLGPGEHVALTWKVRQALAASVTGGESEAAIRALVDSVLEREGDIVVEDDEAEGDEEEDSDEDEDEDDAGDDEDDDEEYDEDGGEE